MKLNLLKTVALLAGLIGAAVAAWLYFGPKLSASSPERTVSAKAAPVEVAAIEYGPMELRRTFSGALESPGQFIIAPKVSGRIERLAAGTARHSRGEPAAGAGRGSVRAGGAPRSAVAW